MLKKYLVAILVLGIYLVAIPYYVEFWNSREALLTTGYIIGNQNGASGTEVKVGVSHSVSIGVTHKYFGGNVPIYINYGDTALDIRIIHEMFFHWIPTILGGIFILFICFDLYNISKDRKTGNSFLYS